MRKLITATSTALLIGCSTHQVTDESLALRKAEAIKTYMSACVVSRANPIAVEDLAKEIGFTLLEGKDAQKYLRGSTGKAWSKKSSSSSYDLTLLENGLCSVFIHQGNPETLQASMEAWLPPENSGFTFEKNLVSNRGSLTTTQYKIYRLNKLAEQWVITTNSQPNAELVAVMSYDGP